MTLLPEVIVFSVLEEAINTRYRVTAKFFDGETAESDKAKNLEILERLKSGEASREDEEAALDLIRSRGY